MLDIVCMLMGKEIPDIYVTRMHSMLKRHVNIPFRLHCITDRKRSIPEDVSIIDARSWSDMRREGMRVTTNKLRLFDPSWLPFDQFLYLDVTLVIQKNMSSLLDHCLNDPLDLMIVQDWNYETYNSCVMRIRQTPSLNKIYRAFQEGKKYEQRVMGDQEFVYSCIKELGMQDRVSFFLPDHVVSYKKIRFLHRKDPAAAFEEISRATIVKFHGADKMHLLLNPLHRVRVMSKNFKHGAKDAKFWIDELRQNWR